MSSIKYKMETQSIMTGSYSLSKLSNDSNLYCVNKDNSSTDVLIACQKTNGGNSIVLFNFAPSFSSSDHSDETLAFALSGSIIISECNPGKYDTLGDAEDAFVDLFGGFESGFDNGDMSKQIVNGVEYGLAFPGDTAVFSASNPDGESPLDDIVPILMD